MRMNQMIKHIAPNLRTKIDRTVLRHILETIVMTDAEMIFGGEIDENKSIIAELTKMSDKKISGMVRKRK